MRGEPRERTEVGKRHSLEARLRTLLTPDRIDRALPHVARGLEKYWWLQSELHRCDVAIDREYQRRFVGFYRVRRNAPWREAFFRLLESGKSKPPTINHVLKHMHAVAGRIEASFASKLIATIDPGMPVIDSVVLKNLGETLPLRTDKRRIEGVATLHRRLAEGYGAFLKTSDGRRLVERFTAEYPAFPVTKTKMLDLVLWQSRERPRR